MNENRLLNGRGFQTVRAAKTANVLQIALNQLASNFKIAQETEQYSVESASQWGWLPAIAVLVACGDALVGSAFAASRNGQAWAEGMFWAGLMLMLLPTTLRLIALGAGRNERLGLVVILGLGLYLVKVMHNPVAFTFPDELTHYRNTYEALINQHLFTPNPGVAATAYYPGLQSITSAIVMLTGMSIFQAGVLVIGIARVIVTASLFLLYEQVSRSARVAGLALLIYIGNSNFTFWSAQFAYESLALPLAALVICLVARMLDEEDASLRRSLQIGAALVLLAVTVTHHMTTAATLAFLWATVLFCAVLLRHRIVGLAVVASVGTIAAGTWLATVAPVTIGYLSPVLGGAIESGINFVFRHESGRQLFQSSSTGQVAPLWERLTGLGSVGLIVLLLPFGLWLFWRNGRRSPLFWLLAVAAVGYLPVMGLRLTSAGWETSNRASAFMYVGLALIIALVLARLPLHWRGGPLVRLAIAAYIAIVFAGGIISGWAPRVRLAQPYVIAAGNQLIAPQGVLASEWMRAEFGADNKVAIDPANAKYMLSYGEQTPLTRRKFGIKSMFDSDNIGRTERSIISKTGVRYVVVDRRLISWDHVAGLYYDRLTPIGGESQTYFAPKVYQKFDLEDDVDRLYDSGDIVIYDVGVFLNDVVATAK